MYLLAAPVKFRFAVRTDKLDEVGQIPKTVKRSVRRTVATADGGRKTVHGPPGGDHLSEAERAQSDPYRDTAATAAPEQLYTGAKQDVRYQTWKDVVKAGITSKGPSSAVSNAATVGMEPARPAGTRHQTSDRQVELPPGAQPIDEPTMTFRTEVKVKMRFYFSSTSREPAEGE